MRKVQSSGAAAAVVITALALGGPAAPGRAAEFSQAEALAKLRAQIAGREKEPAESVFTNIQTLKGMPAGRVLAVMEMGLARSLGVTCTHCHNPENWADDAKRPKGVARDMWKMSAEINNKLLAAIPNLESAKPVVNCTTCHRGQVKPATNLEAPAAPPPAPPPAP